MGSKDSEQKQQLRLPSEIQAGGLPVKAPDLIVVGPVGAKWQVLNVSGGLAEWLNISPDDSRGRFLASLFPETVPPLEDLAREVADRDQALNDIRVRFGDSLVLCAEVVPGGLTEDLRKRVVAFNFSRPPAAEEEPVAQFGMVGISPAIREVFRKISLYAPSDAAVVVTGETGTGKELVARGLHDRSLRNDGPFVAVNCSAISEELLESELFGHEKGAFTGALRRHQGRFERADGGTLFLDEIGDMPMHTQAKLLRVLEEGTVERIGAEHETRVDVRIVAATNLQLEKAVGQGRFRADLYHRLSVLRIHLPPLRERPEDIPALVDHFLRMFSRKYNRRIYRLTPEAIELLQAYLWPGNVRELRNVLERVFVETRSDVIGGRAFREWILERQDFEPGSWERYPSRINPGPALVMSWPLAEDQRNLNGQGQVLEAEFSPVPARRRRSTIPLCLSHDEIKRAFRAAQGNLSSAARMLGVHRASLYRYLKKLGLSRQDLEL
ncbi:MAG: sigma-54 dependent transcriptional regulator [Syntrophotaleaceae bacterium]